MFQQLFISEAQNGFYFKAALGNNAFNHCLDHLSESETHSYRGQEAHVQLLGKKSISLAVSCFCVRLVHRSRFREVIIIDSVQQTEVLELGVYMLSETL